MLRTRRDASQRAGTAGFLQENCGNLTKKLLLLTVWTINIIEQNCYYKYI
jgi:hypothetical protein